MWYRWVPGWQPFHSIAPVSIGMSQTCLPSYLCQNMNWIYKDYLHCRLQLYHPVLWAPGTSRSICHSWIYRHRWTQSRMFQLLRLLSVHLIKHRMKKYIQNFDVCRRAMMVSIKPLTQSFKSNLMLNVNLLFHSGLQIVQFYNLSFMQCLQNKVLSMF